MESIIKNLHQSFDALPAFGKFGVLAALALIVWLMLRPQLELMAIERARKAKRSGRTTPRWIPIGKSGKVACRHCYSPYRPKPENPSCPTCGRDPF
jgi:hypothetical protein